MGYAQRKIDHINALYRLYLDNPQGLTDTEAARPLGIDRTSVHRYRKEMEGLVRPADQYAREKGAWCWKPTPEQVAFAHLILKASGEE